MSDDRSADHSAADTGGDEPASTPDAYGPDPTIPSATLRFVSSLIDALVAVAVYIVSSSLILLVVHPKPGQRLSEGQTVAVSLAFSAIAVLVFSLLERSGGSMGRRVTRTKLVTLDRRLAGWAPLIVRYIAVFVPLISIFGVLLVFLGVTVSGFQRQRRDAFDLLSRTRVVPADQVVTDTA